MSFPDFEDFEKGLLRSAETDEPTAASRAANRAAVMKAAGLAAAGAAASANANASASAGAAGAAGKTTATATATAKVALAAKLAAVPKLVALAAAGVVAVGVAVTAIAVQGSSGGEPVPLEVRPSGSALVRPAPATAAIAAPPESVEHSATGDAGDPSRSVAAARLPSAPASAGPREPSPPALDPLAEETRLLEEARTCMDRGDLTCAAAKLGEHRTRFARGVLTEEAAVLRIQLARRGGDVEEARRLANELLLANPNGPYARRARAILDELSRAEPPDR